MEWSRLRILPRPNRGGGYRRRRGSIYSPTPSSRCSSSWGRTWLERRRQHDQVLSPLTAWTRPSLALEVSDTCIFARVEVDAAIFGLREGSRRGDDVSNAGIFDARHRQTCV